jgi:hypothetical protein
MKRNTLILVTSIVIGFVLFASCDKDEKVDNEPETEVNNESENVPSIAGSNTLVTVPQAMVNSSDVNAQICVGYINMCNTISNYSSIWTVPANAEKSLDVSDLKSESPVLYTWSNGTYTVYWVFKQLSDKNIWELYYSTSTIAKFKVYSAEEMIDGSSGKFIVYDDELFGVEVCSWTWTKTSTKSTFNYKSEDDTIDVNGNTDGSGDIKYYTSGKLGYSATWTSTGTGNWVSYDDDGGQESGTW